MFISLCDLGKVVAGRQHVCVSSWLGASRAGKFMINSSGSCRSDFPAMVDGNLELWEK